MGTRDVEVHAILAHWYGRTVPTPPNTYYVGLSTTNPDAGFVEPDAAAGYVRASYANTAANWKTPANRLTSNVNQITWPQAATADWPVVGYLCLFDPFNALLAWTSMPDTAIKAGVTPFILAGALTISAS